MIAPFSIKTFASSNLPEMNRFIVNLLFFSVYKLSDWLYSSELFIFNEGFFFASFRKKKKTTDFAYAITQLP